MIVDAVSNLFTPAVVATRPDWSAGHMNRRFSVSPDRLEGVELEDQELEMGRAGIDHAILVAPIMGPNGMPGSWHMDPLPVARAVADRPDRFSGQIGIDPTSGLEGVRSLRRMVRDHGFIGAHLYPHWFDEAPDAPRVFPFYQACEELDIPIQIQVGQALVYNKRRPVRSVGRPTALEPVARHFPDLRIIASHLGYPWIDEMIAIATMYPNVYVCTDSYAPKYWPQQFDSFVAGDGVGKVMFGTMWPTIDYTRAVTEIGEKSLSPAAHRNLLGGTAASVYRLRTEGE